MSSLTRIKQSSADTKRQSDMLKSNLSKISLTDKTTRRNSRSLSTGRRRSVLEKSAKTPVNESKFLGNYPCLSDIGTSEDTVKSKVSTAESQHSTSHFISIDESSPYSYSFQSNPPFSFHEVLSEKFSKPSPSTLSGNEDRISSNVSTDFRNNNSPQSKWEAMEIRFLNDNRIEGTQPQSVETSSTCSSQSNHKIVIHSKDTDLYQFPYCKQTVRVEKVEVTNLLRTKREKCGNLSTIRLSEYTGVHDFDEKGEKTLQNMDIKAGQIPYEIWISRNCMGTPKTRTDKGKNCTVVHENFEGAEDNRGVTKKRNHSKDDVNKSGIDANRMGRTESCSDSKGEYDVDRLSQQGVVSCHMAPPVSKSDDEETMSWEANSTSPPDRWTTQVQYPLWMSGDEKGEASELFPSGARCDNTECPLTNSTSPVATPSASHGKVMQKAQADTLEHVSSPETSFKSKESLQVMSTFTCLSSADIEAYKETALGILRQRKKDTEKKMEQSPETDMPLFPNRKQSPPRSVMPSKNPNSRKYPNSGGKSPLGKSSDTSFGKIGKALVTSYNRIKLQMDKHKMRFQKQRSDSQPSAIASSSQISTPLQTDSKNGSLSSRAKSTWEDIERLSSSSRTTHVIPSHYGSKMFRFYIPTPVNSITPPATPTSSGRLSTASENSTSKGTLLGERQQWPVRMSPSMFKFTRNFSDGDTQKRWSKQGLIKCLPSLTHIHPRTTLNPIILEDRERHSDSKGKDEKNVNVESSFSSSCLRNSIESYLGRPEEKEVRLELQEKRQNTENAKSTTKGRAIVSSQDESSDPSSRNVKPAKAHTKIPQAPPIIQGDHSNTTNYPCKNSEKQGTVGSRTLLASDYEDVPQSFSKWVGHYGDGRRDTTARLDFNNEEHFQPPREDVKTTGHMVGDGEQDRTIGYLELFRNILKSPSAKAAQALGHFFQSQGRKKPQALSHIEEESEITVDEIISSYQKIFAELNFSAPPRTAMKEEDCLSGREQHHETECMDCSANTMANQDILNSIELHSVGADNETRRLGTESTRRRPCTNLRSPNFKERLNKRADSLPLRKSSGPHVPCHTLNRARRGTQSTSTGPVARTETKHNPIFPVELQAPKKWQKNPLPVSETNTKRVSLLSQGVGTKSSAASTPGPDALSPLSDENRLLASESYTVHKMSLNHDSLTAGITSDTSVMSKGSSQRFSKLQGNSKLRVTRGGSRLRMSRRSPTCSLVSQTQGSKKADDMMAAKPSKLPIANSGSAAARAKQPAQTKSDAEAAAIVEVRVVNEKLINPTVITISPVTQEQTRSLGTSRSRWNHNAQDNACCNNARSPVAENESASCRAGAHSEKVVSNTKEKSNRPNVNSKGLIGELGDKTRHLGEAPTVESYVLWKMNKLKSFEKRNTTTPKPISSFPRSRQGQTQFQRLIYKRSPLAHSGPALGSKSPCRVAGRGTSKGTGDYSNTAAGIGSAERATQTRVPPRIVSCASLPEHNLPESAPPAKNAKGVAGISQYRNNACHPYMFKQRGVDFQRQNPFKITRSVSTDVLGSSNATGLPLKNRSSPNVTRQASYTAPNSVHTAHLKMVKTKFKECNNDRLCQLQQKPSFETQAFSSKTAHVVLSTSSYESEPILGPSSENNSPIIPHKALASSSTPHSLLVQDNSKDPNRNESKPVLQDRRRKSAANVELRGNVNRPVQTRARLESSGHRENKHVPPSSQELRGGNHDETASRGRKTSPLSVPKVNNAYRNLSAVNLTKPPMKASSTPNESQLYVNDGHVKKEGSRPLLLRELSFQERQRIRSERKPSEKPLVCASSPELPQLPTSGGISKALISDVHDAHVKNVHPAGPRGTDGAVKRCNSSYNLLSEKPEIESVSLTSAEVFAKPEVKSSNKESAATSRSLFDGAEKEISLDVIESTLSNEGATIVQDARFSSCAAQHKTGGSEMDKKETALAPLKSVWNVEEESELSEDDSSQMLRKKTVEKTCEAILKECHCKLYQAPNLGKEATHTVKPTTDSGVASLLTTRKDSPGLSVVAPKDVCSRFSELKDERLPAVNVTAHHNLYISTDGKEHCCKELHSVNARYCSVEQTYGAPDNVSLQCSERIQQLNETIPNRDYEAKVNSMSEELSWSVDGMKSSMNLEKSKKERVNLSQEDLPASEEKKMEIAESNNLSNPGGKSKETNLNQPPSTAILDNEARNERNVRHSGNEDIGKKRDTQGRQQHQDSVVCNANTSPEEAEDTVHSSTCYHKEDRRGEGNAQPEVITGLKNTSHDTSPTLVFVQNTRKKHNLPFNTEKDLSEIRISSNSCKISFQDAKRGPEGKLTGQKTKVTPPFNITVLSPPTKPQPKVSTTSPDPSRKTNRDSPIVCVGNDEIILKPTIGNFQLILKAQSCTVDQPNQINIGESDVVVVPKSPEAAHKTIATEENVVHILHQQVAQTYGETRRRIEPPATLDSNEYKENNIQGRHKVPMSMSCGAKTYSRGGQYQHTQPGDSRNSQITRSVQQQCEDARGPIWKTGDVKNAERQNENLVSTTTATQYESRYIPPKGMSTFTKSSIHVSTAIVQERSMDKCSIADERLDMNVQGSALPQSSESKFTTDGRTTNHPGQPTKAHKEPKINLNVINRKVMENLELFMKSACQKRSSAMIPTQAKADVISRHHAASAPEFGNNFDCAHLHLPYHVLSTNKSKTHYSKANVFQTNGAANYPMFSEQCLNSTVGSRQENTNEKEYSPRSKIPRSTTDNPSCETNKLQTHIPGCNSFNSPSFDALLKVWEASCTSETNPESAATVEAEMSCGKTCKVERKNISSIKDNRINHSTYNAIGVQKQKNQNLQAALREKINWDCQEFTDDGWNTICVKKQEKKSNNTLAADNDGVGLGPYANTTTGIHGYDSEELILFSDSSLSSIEPSQVRRRMNMDRKGKSTFSGSKLTTSIPTAKQISKPSTRETACSKVPPLLDPYPELISETKQDPFGELSIPVTHTSDPKHSTACNLLLPEKPYGQFPNIQRDTHQIEYQTLPFSPSDIDRVFGCSKSVTSVDDKHAQGNTCSCSRQGTAENLRNHELKTKGWTASQNIISLSEDSILNSQSPKETDIGFLDLKDLEIVRNSEASTANLLSEFENESTNHTSDQHNLHTSPCPHVSNTESWISDVTDIDTGAGLFQAYVNAPTSKPVNFHHNTLKLRCPRDTCCCYESPCTLCKIPKCSATTAMRNVTTKTDLPSIKPSHANLEILKTVATLTTKFLDFFRKSNTTKEEVKNKRSWRSKRKNRLKRLRPPTLRKVLSATSERVHLQDPDCTTGEACTESEGSDSEGCIQTYYPCSDDNLHDDIVHDSEQIGKYETMAPVTGLEHESRELDKTPRTLNGDIMSCRDVFASLALNLLVSDQCSLTFETISSELHDVSAGPVGANLFNILFTVRIRQPNVHLNNIVSVHIPSLLPYHPVLRIKVAKEEVDSRIANPLNNALQKSLSAGAKPCRAPDAGSLNGHQEIVENSRECLVCQTEGFKRNQHHFLSEETSTVFVDIREQQDDEQRWQGIFSGQYENESLGQCHESFQQGFPMIAEDPSFHEMVMLIASTTGDGQDLLTQSDSRRTSNRSDFKKNGSQFGFRNSLSFIPYPFTAAQMQYEEPCQAPPNQDIYCTLTAHEVCHHCRVGYVDHKAWTDDTFDNLEEPGIKRINLDKERLSERLFQKGLTPSTAHRMASRHEASSRKRFDRGIECIFLDTDRKSGGWVRRSPMRFDRIKNARHVWECDRDCTKESSYWIPSSDYPQEDHELANSTTMSDHLLNLCEEWGRVGFEKEFVEDHLLHDECNQDTCEELVSLMTELNDSTLRETPSITDTSFEPWTKDQDQNISRHTNGEIIHYIFKTNALTTENVGPTMQDSDNSYGRPNDGQSEFHKMKQTPDKNCLFILTENEDKSTSVSQGMCERNAHGEMLEKSTQALLGIPNISEAIGVEPPVSCQTQTDEHRTTYPAPIIKATHILVDPGQEIVGFDAGTTRFQCHIKKGAKCLKKPVRASDSPSPERKCRNKSEDVRTPSITLGGSQAVDDTLKQHKWTYNLVTADKDQDKIPFSKSNKRSKKPKRSKERTGIIMDSSENIIGEFDVHPWRASTVRMRRRNNREPVDDNLEQTDSNVSRCSYSLCTCCPQEKSENLSYAEVASHGLVTSEYCNSTVHLWPGSITWSRSGCKDPPLLSSCSTKRDMSSRFPSTVSACIDLHQNAYHTCDRLILNSVSRELPINEPSDPTHKAGDSRTYNHAVSAATAYDNKETNSTMYDHLACDQRDFGDHIYDPIVSPDCSLYENSFREVKCPGTMISSAELQVLIDLSEDGNTIDQKWRKSSPTASAFGVSGTEQKEPSSNEHVETPASVSCHQPNHTQEEDGDCKIKRSNNSERNDSKKKCTCECYRDAHSLIPLILPNDQSICEYSKFEDTLSNLIRPGLCLDKDIHSKQSESASRVGPGVRTLELKAHEPSDSSSTSSLLYDYGNLQGVLSNESKLLWKTLTKLEQNYDFCKMCKKRYKSLMRQLKMNSSYAQAVGKRLDNDQASHNAGVYRLSYPVLTDSQNSGNVEYDHMTHRKNQVDLYLCVDKPIPTLEEMDTCSEKIKHSACGNLHNVPTILTKSIADLAEDPIAPGSIKECLPVLTASVTKGSVDRPCPKVSPGSVTSQADDSREEITGPNNPATHTSINYVQNPGHCYNTARDSQDKQDCLREVCGQPTCHISEMKKLVDSRENCSGFKDLPKMIEASTEGHLDDQHREEDFSHLRTTGTHQTSSLIKSFRVPIDVVAFGPCGQSSYGKAETEEVSCFQHASFEVGTPKCSTSEIDKNPFASSEKMPGSTHECPLVSTPKVSVPRSLPFEHSPDADADTLIEKLGTILNEMHQTFPDTPRVSPKKSTSTEILSRSHKARERYLNIYRNNKRPMGNISFSTRPASFNISYPPSPPAPPGHDPSIREQEAIVLLENQGCYESAGLKSFGPDQSVWAVPSLELSSATDAVSKRFNRPNAAESNIHIPARQVLGNKSAKVGSAIEAMDAPCPYSEPEATHTAVNSCAPALVGSETVHHVPSSQSYPSLCVPKSPVSSLSSNCTTSSLEARGVQAPATEIIGSVKNLVCVFEGKNNNTSQGLDVLQQSKTIDMGTLTFQPQETEIITEIYGGRTVLGEFQEVNSEREKNHLSQYEHLNTFQYKETAACCIPSESSFSQRVHLSRDSLLLTGAQRENSQNINRDTLLLTDAQCENSQNINRSTLSLNDTQREQSQNINTGTLSLTGAQRENSQNIVMCTLSLADAQHRNSQNINGDTLSLTDAQCENSQNVNGGTLSLSDAQQDNSQNINRGTLSFTDVECKHSQCTITGSLSLTGTEQHSSEAVEKNTAFHVGPNCLHLDFESQQLLDPGSSMACAHSDPEAVHGLTSLPKSHIALPDSQPKEIHPKMLEQEIMAATTEPSESGKTASPAQVEGMHELGSIEPTSTQRLHDHDNADYVNFAEEADKDPHYLGEIEEYVLAQPHTYEESNDVQNCALREAVFGEDEVNIDLFQLNGPAEMHSCPVYGDVCDTPQSWPILSCDDTQAETGTRSSEDRAPRPVEIPVDIYTVPMWSSLHETTKKQRVKKREEEVPTRTVVISGPIINMSMPVCRHRSVAAANEARDGAAICETDARTLNTAPVTEGTGPHADPIQALGSQEVKVTGWKSAIKRILPFGKGTAKKDASSRTLRRQWKNS